jgi:hypothetical protein
MPPDWWSIPEDEIDEINKGNVLFLNLGSDGDYTVKIHDDIDGNYFSLFLKVPSGKFTLVPGKTLAAVILSLMVLITCLVFFWTWSQGSMKLSLKKKMIK